MASRTAPPARRAAPARAAGPQGRRPSQGRGRRPAPRRANLVDYPRAGRGNPWRWVPTIRLLLLLGLLGLIAALGAVVLAYRLTTIPAEEASASYATSTVYYADGTTPMADFSSDINRKPLREDEIPDSVKKAIVASEDRTFYDNRGISVTGLGRAVYGVATGRNLGGGSTITQQYVKNIYGDDAPTYARKAREALLALKIDERDTKDQVLARYLNTIYFGRNASGIQTAARAYFAKDAKDLTVPEAALLVGVVPAPSAWDPAVNEEKAQERYTYVIDSMVANGALTAQEAAAIPTMPATVEQGTPETYRGPNGYILQAVRAELVAKGIPQDEIDRGGLTIVTTIDARMQQAAVEAMDDPEAYPTKGRPATLQAGLVSIDPATGAVRAMYAGADYLARQRNAVTQDTAQAGSTFKPFTLVAALEDGYTLRDTLDGGSPRTFKQYTDGNGKQVPVNNFGRRGAGTVTLQQATAGSVNTAYVELNLDVGPPATKAVAERAGLPDDTEAAQLGLDPIPASASNVLGTASVRPIDMAEAYATFAAQGVHHEAHLVERVTQDGRPRFTADPTGEQVFDPAVMADATAAMQAVVTDGSAERYASRLGRPAAGKTGTSQSSKAAWFSGFTPQLATTVVLFNVADGSDPAVAAGTELEIPGFGGITQITGGSWPTAIWTRYTEAALADSPEIDFPPPTKARSTRTPTATPSASATRTPSASATQQPTATPSAPPSESAPPAPQTSTPSATEPPTEPEPTSEPSPAEPSAPTG